MSPRPIPTIKMPVSSFLFINRLVIIISSMPFFKTEEIWARTFSPGMYLTHQSFKSKIEKVPRGTVFKVRSREKIRQVRLNWSQQLEYKQVPKSGTELGAQKGKRFKLVSHTRCNCSMDTTGNSVKVKPSIKVIKLVESLIGWEVTVTGQGSERHL